MVFLVSYIVSYIVSYERTLAHLSLIVRWSGIGGCCGASVIGGTGGMGVEDWGTWVRYRWGWCVCARARMCARVCAVRVWGPEMSGEARCSRSAYFEDDSSDRVTAACSRNKLISDLFFSICRTRPSPMSSNHQQ